MLLDHLPRHDSALVAALSGDDAEVREWTLDRHLLAGVVDRLDLLAHLLGANLQALGAVKRNPIPAPVPISRPGVAVDDGMRSGRGMRSLVRALGAPV